MPWWGWIIAGLTMAAGGVLVVLLPAAADVLLRNSSVLARGLLGGGLMVGGVATATFPSIMTYKNQQERARKLLAAHRLGILDNAINTLNQENASLRTTIAVSEAKNDRDEAAFFQMRQEKEYATKQNLFLLKEIQDFKLERERSAKASVLEERTVAERQDMRLPQVCHHPLRVGVSP